MLWCVHIFTGLWLRRVREYIITFSASYRITGSCFLVLWLEFQVGKYEFTTHEQTQSQYFTRILSTILVTVYTFDAYWSKCIFELSRIWPWWWPWFSLQKQQQNMNSEGLRMKTITTVSWIAENWHRNNNINKIKFWNDHEESMPTLPLPKRIFF